ncbi:MAG: YHYH protein [Reichenbachiella sp.]|uniref:YHYH protein n=1 Tax=Reichenbachiella sp. TaxID=2184521 RepID=UPI002967111E|nr:YHYH protein [Reichenbachiella sp.]MDW3209595.1 YHYH protein [Reichenbachiella sp.]
MRGKKKFLSAILFSMIAVLFVRCTEEAKDALDELTDTDILVKVSATQDGSEAGNSVKFNVSLQDASGDAVTNSTGAALTATAAFSGTATAADFDTDLPSTISIANGSSNTTVELAVKDDSDVEGEETLILTLSAANVGEISIGTATAKVIDNDEEVPTSTTDISVLKDHFYHTTALTFDIGEEFITITAKDLPDHKSMYYDAENDLYEDYDEPNNNDFKKNPNTIGEQNLVYKIPRYPAEASVKETTPMGSMGVAINSVSIFNQEAAPGDDILDELNTFDQYEGHPAGTEYHYHIEPVWLTQFRANADNEALVGILLDGFPVYGTHEDGVQVTNDDLNDYHGHFGVTDDFPNGIFHYHITDDLPWINGDGFYGTPGTVTN